jgi:hypothetical protein
MSGALRWQGSSGTVAAAIVSCFGSHSRKDRKSKRYLPIAAIPRDDSPPAASHKAAEMTAHFLADVSISRMSKSMGVERHIYEAGTYLPAVTSKKGQSHEIRITRSSVAGIL